MNKKQQDIYGYVVIDNNGYIESAYLLQGDDTGIYLTSNNQDVSELGGVQIIAPAGNDVFGTLNEAEIWIKNNNK